MSPDGFTKPPPEEKLLRLIRGKAPHAAAGGGVSPRHRGSSDGVFPSADLMARARQLNWAQAAAILLGLVLAFEGIWVLAQLVRPLPEVPMSPAEPPAPTPNGVVGPAAAPDVEMPSIAASVDRPLFSASAGGRAAPSRQAMSGSAKLLASRLTLTGVVSGDPPQAIIEDTQAQKTYFVTVGQPLAEGAVLDEVLDNRVILDFQGEKIELSL
ncbi:MAG: hypothetical protein HY599_01350 [Candidatus Omnitrophica bacterium]|nr:hypothetical protein [Candidatus Omnitrophota bacterium]